MPYYDGPILCVNGDLEIVNNQTRPETRNYLRDSIIELQGGNTIDQGPCGFKVG